MMFLWILVFIIALAVLIFSSDYFTAAAEEIGLYYGIPAFIVGITIVSIGTSLPELISSIFAVMKGSSEIIIGNVVGSNITNMFLVLGLAALIGSWNKPILFKFDLFQIDMPIFIGSAFVLGLAIFDGVFSRLEASLFLLGYIVYIVYSIFKTKDFDKVKKEKKFLLDQVPHKNKKNSFPLRSFGILGMSSLMIFFGAKFTIDAVIHLSQLFHMGTDVIALSAVALGTSLPELSVSIAATRRGSFEMALGNVLGSNIFNVFMVMSIPAFISSLFIPPSFLLFYIPLLIIASILVLLIIRNKKITLWEGFLLVSCYVLFMLKIFM